MQSDKQVQILEWSMVNLIQPIEATQDIKIESLPMLVINPPWWTKWKTLIRCFLQVKKRLYHLPHWLHQFEFVIPGEFNTWDQKPFLLLVEPKLRQELVQVSKAKVLILKHFKPLTLSFPKQGRIMLGAKSKLFQISFLNFEINFFLNLKFSLQHSRF